MVTRVVFGFLAMGACASVVDAKELWDRPWLEVESPNFRVMSMLDEPQTRELVVDLENFRRAVEMFTNIERFEAPIPTKVFLLSKPERELGFGQWVGGYFAPQMRQNVAVVGEGGAKRASVLKHEYVHFLLNNRDRRLYPPWFHEGFAEFLATLTVDEGVVSFGRSSELRGAWLAGANWMPYARLLDIRDVQALGRQEGSMFYAQSWLLVHYLNFGGTTPNLSARQAEFLALCERGAAPADAFERAFGHKVDRMRAVLYKYAQALPYHQLRPDAPFPEVSTRIQAMAPADIATELGWLVFTIGSGPERAQSYFEAALAHDADHSGALVALGDVLKVAERYDEAKPRYERAIALDPDNAEHELDFGEFYLERALATEDVQQREALLVEARRHFARSYAIAPNIPETLAMNGRSYLVPGGDADKAIASLEAAHALLPAQAEVRFLLAQAYLAADEKSLAREQLETLLGWGSPENTEQIRALLASLGEDLETGAGDHPPRSE